MATFNKVLKKIECMVLMSLVAFTACKKFVQVPPPVSGITAETVYTNNGSAAAAMTGIYNRLMIGALSGGSNSISSLEGLQADELQNYSNSAAQIQFYTNSLSSSTGGGSNSYFWQELYQDIYIANSVIAGLNSSSGVTAAMKQQLTGEAEFMRAFLYFYAVNLYGDVPLALTTDYQTNTSLSRTPKAQVYLQIIADLKDAQSKLSSNFVDYQGLVTTARIRPNKGAATAMLARVYLYYGNLTGDQSNYTKAVTQADSVIASTSQYSLVSNLNSVFLANSKEAIFQMQPITTGYNTFDAYYYVLTSAPGTGHYYYAMSTYLLNAFEPNDQRFADWVGQFTSNGTTYYYPYKYKVWQQNQPVTEYLMVLRLAEQYLIRAEAEADLGDAADAVSDLNIIRTRAGLPAYAGATDKTSLLTAILHERQVELFTEWGHRWFDLVRTNMVSSVMGSPGNVCQAKGGTWNTDWELLPLPLSELQVNHNLTQNPGY